MESSEKEGEVGSGIRVKARDGSSGDRCVWVGGGGLEPRGAGNSHWAASKSSEIRSKVKCYKIMGLLIRKL